MVRVETNNPEYVPIPTSDGYGTINENLVTEFCCPQIESKFDDGNISEITHGKGTLHRTLLNPGLRRRPVWTRKF